MFIVKKSFFALHELKLTGGSHASLYNSIAYVNTLDIGTVVAVLAKT